MTGLVPVLLALATLALPARAAANFEPMPMPPGGSEVAAFAAAGDTWAAMMESFGGSDVQLSRDSGASWQKVTSEVGLWDGPTVAPDGAFWFVGKATYTSERKLVRIAPDGAVSYLPIQVPRAAVSPPAFDAQGRMWVAAIEGDDDGTAHAIRLNSDGTQAEDVQARSYDSGLVYIRFVGDLGFIGTENQQYILSGGRLKVVSGPPAAKEAEFVGKAMWPVAASGGALFMYWAMSPDGGRTFTKTARPQLGVEGRADLLVRWPFAGQPSATIVRRCGFLFCNTGLDVPEGTAAVWSTAAGLVAVSAPPAGPTGPVFRQAPVFAIHRGPLPPIRTTPGPIAPRARALIGTVNRYRKAAGLPPLVLDPAISRAAYNHARYLSRNPPDPKDPIRTAHVEVSGKAGFTGVNPGDRCRTEGGSCNTEAVIPGIAPVEGVLGSYYHRIWLLGSFAQVAGAATYRGYTVFEVDADRATIPTKPYGYPTGRYDGPLRLGPEIPDPTELCRGPLAFRRGQAGVPVIFYPPGQEPSRPMNLQVQIRYGPDVRVQSVELFRGKRRVRGCTSPLAAFISHRPLLPHTRYTAKARWRPTPKSPFQTYTWSFRTR